MRKFLLFFLSLYRIFLSTQSKYDIVSLALFDKRKQTMNFDEHSAKVWVKAYS